MPSFQAQRKNAYLQELCGRADITVEQLLKAVDNLHPECLDYYDQVVQEQDVELYVYHNADDFYKHIARQKDWSEGTGMGDRGDFYWHSFFTTNGTWLPNGTFDFDTEQNCQVLVVNHHYCSFPDSKGETNSSVEIVHYNARATAEAFGG